MNSAVYIFSEICSKNRFLCPSTVQALNIMPLNGAEDGTQISTKSSLEKMSGILFKNITYVLEMHCNKFSKLRAE
jgi:hypothetical protein